MTKLIILNMDQIKEFITNPLSGLLAGITAGALAGYQIGLQEGNLKFS